MNPDPPIRIWIPTHSRFLMTKYLKILQFKKINFGSKIDIYLSLGLREGIFELSVSVSDLYSFDSDMDPDPVFKAEYRSVSRSNPDPIRIQGFG